MSLIHAIWQVLKSFMGGNVCEKVINLNFCFLLLTSCNTLEITNNSSSFISEPEYVDVCFIIPQTIVEMMSDFKCDNVVTFEVLSAKSEINMETTDENHTDYINIVKAKVDRSYKGDIKNGEIFNIVQLGDGVHQIYQHIEETLGYYKSGEKYLAFLEDLELEKSKKELIKGVNKAYSANSHTGQFLINENDEIIKHPSKYDLFPDAKTVDDIINQIP